MTDLLLRDVVEALDGLYPPGSAAGWDQVGLVAGDLDQPVRRVLLALDPTLAVVDEAVEWGADLVVTHHPLLLRGIHSVATTDAKGATLTRLVTAGVALFNAHTNADVAQPGVSSVLADALGLQERRPLSTETMRDGRSWPLGWVGELADPVTLADFADAVARALPDSVGGIRVAGDPGGTVRTVAVLGGSGDDRFADVERAGADVYVTADLRHHPVLEAREQARGGPPYLVDAGHWATESLWLADVRERLLAVVSEEGAAPVRVEARVSRVRTEPWTFVVGANAAQPHPGGAP
ncbi:dinuclear metal center YbgI/SA1388 family protein [Terracoccus luteus]|uniref:GTP cyclohydrolase 1 type 2 homolog n=1 Tax=Terracoccus luteus TaxID=53356 RepID=A0A495XW36_9MICO|nr:Nif3-like dinuclear metal center hexameric protein [Terracoccus luteus]RKT77719.1 dinuclear metal center YbgI/SA1388 family protein [Terracoccus luteus]